MTQAKPPIDTIRDGAIKATIWENGGENGPYLSVTLSKTYSDGQGNPRDTQSFSGVDLLRVSEVARQAYSRQNELRMAYQFEDTREHRETPDRTAPREEFSRGANRAPGRSQPRARR